MKLFIAFVHYRVCKRWKRLVKDQKLWRFVDLTTWKRVSYRTLVFKLSLSHSLSLSHTHIYSLYYRNVKLKMQ